jgi:hypothetical protein
VSATGTWVAFGESFLQGPFASRWAAQGELKPLLWSVQMRALKRPPPKEKNEEKDSSLRSE